MKKIFNILTVTVVALLAMTSCQSSKESFATAGEADSPRILNTDIPEGTAGNPARLMTVRRNANFNFEIIVTPVKFCTVSWYIDGQKVFEGNEIDMPLLSGNHLVKVVAETTMGLQTSRTFTVAVNPLDEDPTTEETQLLAAPGQDVEIAGTNLDAVAKFFLGSLQLEIIEASSTSIMVTLPADLEAGIYPVTVETVSGETVSLVHPVDDVYEAFTIAASTEPLVSTALLAAKPGQDVTISGINLHNVQSLTLGGENAPIVSQSFDALVFTCPYLDKGQYDITGLDNNGKAISFAGQDHGTVNVTKEEVLWEGSFNVTWGTPFDGVKETLLNYVHVGSIVRGYVSGQGQGCLATSWWNNIYTGEGDPNRGDSMISGDMVLEYTLTQTSLDLLAAQNGALFVGDGYTITKVTVE